MARYVDNLSTVPPKSPWLLQTRIQNEGMLYIEKSLAQNIFFLTILLYT